MFGVKKILFLVCVVYLTLFIVLRNPVLVFKSPVKVNKQASPQKLYSHVESLVTTSKGNRNYLNVPALNQAASYIKNNFDQYCDSTSYQIFKVGTVEYKNVRCFFESSFSQEWIVLGGHYDVAHEQQGADDNASGTAAVIELARLLSYNRSKLKHPVELVAYTLEEPPFFRTPSMGSAVHAKSLHEQNKKVKFMISIEMIGYYSNEPGSQQYPISALKAFYPSVGNFITLVGNYAGFIKMRKLKSLLSQTGTLPLYSINAPVALRGIDFSDHMNYWKYGFDAYMLTDTAFYRNKNYHQVTDTIETLDFDKMADLTNKVLYTILNF